MTKMLKYFQFLLYSTIFFSSCSIDSKRTLSSDAFTAVLSELIEIESMNIPDTLKAILISRHLQEKNLKINEFNSYINFDKGDSVSWQNIYERVNARIKGGEN